MEKIVLKLNNTDLHYHCSAIVFTMFEALIQNSRQVVQNFVEDLNCFSLNDYYTLHERIVVQKENQVAMNEKQVVIYYTVLHFMCWVFGDAEQSDSEMEQFPEEKREDLKKECDQLLVFAKVSIYKIKRDLAKNKNLNAAFKKIAAIDMDEL